MGFLPISDEGGFTLATSLLTVVIIMLTMPLLTFTFKQIERPLLSEDIKYQQFFHFLHDDILRAKRVYTGNNTIYFESRNGDIATIAQYNYTVRRQVRGVGHEEYLRDVKIFQAKQKDHYIDVKVTSNTGEIYEKKLPIYE